MCATIDHWDRKLANWSLWAVSGSRVSVSNPFHIPRGWDAGAPPNAPALVGEAFDVDTLICKLPELLHNAIVVYYCLSGPLTLRCRQAGVSERTLRDRRRQACFKLDDLDCARRRAVVRPPARAA